jgi:L-seryl-tRNA(Ser) seleniumtransferase
MRRLGLAAMLTAAVACANIQPPPGGPPDTRPPELVGVFPDSAQVGPGFNRDAEFRFSEVVSEGSSASQGAGTGGLERLVLLSPTDRPPKVGWHRSRITVRPAEGWKPNRVYRIELLPGIADVRRNVSKAARVVTFSTGAPLPTDTVRGTVIDWKAGRPAAGALVEAVLQPDSLPYRTIADSSGRFTLGPIPKGEYLVFGTLDQNRNLRRDPREAFDTVRIAPDSNNAVEIYAFVHDTLPPRIQSIDPVDSVTARITFAQPLDPFQKLDPAQARVVRLPDSTEVPVVALLRSDTAGAPGAAPVMPAPPEAGVPGARDTARAPAQASAAAGAQASAAASARGAAARAAAAQRPTHTQGRAAVASGRSIQHRDPGYPHGERCSGRCAGRARDSEAARRSPAAQAGSPARLAPPPRGLGAHASRLQPGAARYGSRPARLGTAEASPMTDPRRDLPSVDRLLREPAVAALLTDAPRAAVLAAVRDAIAAARSNRAGPPEDWAAEVRERLVQRTARSLRPALNATGVVLHTNLGRAPLAPAALEAIATIAGGYSTLEFDLHTGTRGSRADHCRALLAELTGTADGLAVNNAAGALVLALNALADGREVLISRGELIEIGGSFRIPDIIEKSGARLREVGTTNRTHLDDYRRAIGRDTAAILTVHRSNFEQRGFVATPEPAALAGLAHEAGLPHLHDVGSGLLVDLAPWGLTSEPDVRGAVRAGADLVLFSGDKLLGGPQAGCLVGRRDLVDRCRRNPFARALRADKLTLAALEATLALYRDPETARREIPVLAMLTATPAELAVRAAELARACPAELRPELLPGESAVGGGSFPGAVLPTTVVALDPGPLGAESLALRLRLQDPAVITRIADRRVILDPRTLPPGSIGEVAAAVQRSVGV